MDSIFTKIRRWWLFNLKNPVVRAGESDAFKWKFRRFWLEIETKSGNFKARFTASEHPYGYLVYSDDDQVSGFAEMVYYVGSLLTASQSFVNDVDQAFKNFCMATETEAPVEEHEEEQALEEERQLQEYLELPKKERRKVDRDINNRFKRVEKEMKKKSSEE